MANRGISPLPRLGEEQAIASSPRAQVRLSASAGTGKTQVLTARVLKLLLAGVKPEAILCLTFTKAGAAEMADRIQSRLGGWVTMESAALALDLKNLGEGYNPSQQETARGLFARVLDSPGAGLRIQTIHSFCQTLLAGFPAEAGLFPGAEPIEGRAEQLLADQALADMVIGFEEQGELGQSARLERIAERLAEGTIRTFLKNCSANPDWIDHVPQGAGLDAYVRRTLSGGIDDIDDVLATVCSDGGFDRIGLEALKHIHLDRRKKDGSVYVDSQRAADRIAAWLDASPEERVDGLKTLRLAWLTEKGEWRKSEPDDPSYRPRAEALDGWIERLILLGTAAHIAPVIADALHIGRSYAQCYRDAKRKAGAVDFNDLIRSTVKLLKQPGIGEWVRFKLDQSVDHILVDEAQDTNAEQWEIVKAIAEDFFTGAGAKGDALRTVFKVGDFKQAIFGFQGTNPLEFEKATDFFATSAEQAEQDYLRLSLSQSFRSSQPILDLTDAVIKQIGHQAMGLAEMPDLHRSGVEGSGRILLMPPVHMLDEGGGEQEDESWLSEAELAWARQLAKSIKYWTNGGLYLRNQGRAVAPGDVMILVRSRAERARLIVSRLYEEGVPVAGVDRLLLGSPIVVQDLLACIRFVLQPDDDLTLACILVSPLVGWSQEMLYERGKGREGISLWQHLGTEKPQLLRDLLNIANFVTPYQFIETILSGPHQGRKKLIARLGEEARDPIEALLTAALTFEQELSPTLQHFVDWFDSGAVEIKRDPSKPENAVRVMTVHGAKGLQAPVVILADATADPDFKRPTTLDWLPEAGVHIPLFRPKKDEMVPSLTESALLQDAREADEHWRLLYVAMTRAEEHLIVGGALKPKQIGKPLGERCWYGRIEAALLALGASPEAEGIVLNREAPTRGTKKDELQAIEHWSGDFPTWAMGPAPTESRPPKPLAPSAIESPDIAADPPSGADRLAAARRGTLLHSLFERLPNVAAADRREVATRWLMQGQGLAPAECDALIDDSLQVIENPAFAPFFSREALAEAPLAGVVNGQVIAGTVDRLLITDDVIWVIDFKTGKYVPSGPDKVSSHHKAQMAAYHAVLSQLFPKHQLRIGLLYAQGPALIELEEQHLAVFKPGFSALQEEFAAAG